MSTRTTSALCAILGALSLPLGAACQGRWVDTRHDFGAFDEQTGTVTTRFLLVNDGHAPLSIIDARANCGCTTPRYDPEPVAPGDTAVMTVGFDPSGRPGAFTKNIQVTVESDGRRQRQRLEIAGTVLGASNTLRSRFTYGGDTLRLRQRQMQFGDVTRPGTHVASLAGINAGRDSVTITPSGFPEWLNVTVQPSRVPPSGTFTLMGELDTEAADAWGIVTGEFTLMPGQVRVEVAAVVREDFSRMTPEQMRQAPKAVVETQSLDLGRIPRHGRATRRLRLTNAGHSPLLLRAVQSSEPGLTVKAPDKVKAGQTEEIEVTFDPDSRPDAWLNARLTLVTNDPLRPSQAVRVVGTIEDR